MVCHYEDCLQNVWYASKKERDIYDTVMKEENYMEYP